MQLPWLPRQYAVRQDPSFMVYILQMCENEAIFGSFSPDYTIQREVFEWRVRDCRNGRHGGGIGKQRIQTDLLPTIVLKEGLASFNALLHNWIVHLGGKTWLRLPSKIKKPKIRAVLQRFIGYKRIKYSKACRHLKAKIRKCLESLSDEAWSMNEST